MRKRVDDLSQQSFLQSSGGARSLSNRSVLLVAAGRLQADHCRSILMEAGSAVDLSRSVSGAMERLAGRTYDAMVLDWKTLHVESLPGDWRQTWLRLSRASRARHSRPVGLVTLFAAGTAAPPEVDSAGALAITQSGSIDSGTLTSAIALAIERHALELGTTAATSPSPTPALDSLLIGRSAAMSHVMEQVRMVAPKDTTVLITGETGTGKERVSRAIHLLSRRRAMEMVSVNCGGIPATLLEDEFFGHVKGAFTDARSARVGRFEQANGSTLFLDEIGDLPLELQPKLLRALQEREIHRIGGVEAIQLDVRVIAATNMDLWRRVQETRFREDLFYRINVYPIHLPPLRERREDVPLFLRHFVERFCRRDHLPPKRLVPAAEEALMKRLWRGNIRELENAVEMAVIRSQVREEITLEDFPPPRDTVSGALELPTRFLPGEPGSDGADYRTLVQRFERDLIVQALALAQGNKNKAAQLLRLKRTTLIEKLKRFDIPQNGG